MGAGAKIIDVSKIYNYEIDYDFEDKLSIGQLIVGANLRQYNLNTKGTLYTDYTTSQLSIKNTELTHSLSVIFLMIK